MLLYIKFSISVCVSVSVSVFVSVSVSVCVSVCFCVPPGSIPSRAELLMFPGHEVNRHNTPTKV